jgi:dual-specificity kinase
MVFDLLSQSLFDFFQQNKFAPFSIRQFPRFLIIRQIQSFAQQILKSLAFLHENRLIHTDLKPENLMLFNNETVVINQKKTRRILKDPRIVLIDFGSTILQEDYHSAIVSTRHYRAPEILLSLGWSFPCDIVGFSSNLVVTWMYSSRTLHWNGFISNS